MMAPDPYYCIHCGFESPQVYKTYAEGNLVKLLKCKKCKELVDPYVEFDLIIVAINIVLQNKMAYRHLILNEAFSEFWKLGVLFLFCEAYCYWCFQKGMSSEGTTTVDFYELEINFYRALLRTVIGTFLFHALVQLSCFLPYRLLNKNRPTKFSYSKLWKGLCLCGFSKMFELVALIWWYNNNQSTILFVNGLFILSNIQSYQCVTDASLKSAVIVISFSFLVCKMFFHVYDIFLPI